MLESCDDVGSWTAEDAEGWWHANIPNSLANGDDDAESLDAEPPAAERQSVPSQQMKGGYSLTAWCFLTHSGSMSTPNPGPVGTLIFPLTTCKGDVLHSNRTFVRSPLNS